MNKHRVKKAIQRLVRFVRGAAWGGLAAST
jgi:hypothetical protein